MVTKESIDSPDRVAQEQHEAHRACLFSVCGELLAIDVEHLYEVVQDANMTYLPKVPMGLAGVVNFRGEILPVIDLAPWLTSNSRQGEEAVRVMIVQSGGTQAGLRIDAVKDVATFQEMLPAEGEILRPGLEVCLRPVQAESFQSASVTAGGTVWRLLVAELFDRLAEIYSTSRTEHERSH